MSLKQKILIVDDNEDIVLMLKTMLTIKGYKANVKTDVQKLEKYILKTNPDLIIMDMLLSGADGRLICSNLKSIPEFASIPILMISAHPAAKEDCLNSGADHFLAKPFDMKIFLKAVQESIGNANLSTSEK